MTTEMTERRQRHRPDPSDVELDEPAPTHTPVDAIARVDLVPPIVEARRRHAATERKLMVGMLALLVAVVAAGLAMAALAMSAESTLSAERTRAQVLLNEQKKYSEVSSIKAHLGGYDGAELAALYSEASWSRLMTELDAILPADVSLATESITVKVVADDAA